MELAGEDCPCTLNEVELFDPASKQVVLQRSKTISYSPVTSLVTNDGVIEFSIEGSSDEFIDLNDTELVVECKIVNAADNVILKATDDIAPTNNWLHTMFSDVKLEIQNQVIEGGEFMYGYKAYLYNLLTHSKESKSTQLENSCWIKDTAGHMNVATAANIGYTLRKALASESKTIQLSGPLLLDMMLQNRYLLPQTNFKILLSRMKPEYQLLMHTGAAVEGRATALKVIIENATLYIKKVKAVASFVETIENTLITQNARYPIQHTRMNTFTISTGVLSFNCQSLFSGQLPKLVFLALVRNDAYNGAYNQNPFNFEHFNLDSLKLSDSSGTSHYEEYNPDFANNKFAREYTALYKAMGIYNQADSIDITKNEFKNGFTIFGFNLTPDGHASGHVQVTHNSNVRLDLKFSTALATSINLVAMGIFDANVQITKERKVICSWKS